MLKTKHKFLILGLFTLFLMHTPLQCFFWKKPKPNPTEITENKTIAGLFTTRSIISGIIAASYISIFIAIASKIEKKPYDDGLYFLQCYYLRALIPGIIISLHSLISSYKNAKAFQGK